MELFSGFDCSFGDERFEKESMLLRLVRGDSAWVVVVFKNGTCNGGEIDRRRNETAKKRRFFHCF